MGVFGEIWDALRNPIDYVGEKLGDINYDAQKRIQQNAYQNTVYDLKKAGLNPMLAYMNGSNGASTSAASLGDVINGAGDIGSMLPNGKLKTTRKSRDLEAQQGKLMEAQTAAALADKASKDATTAKTVEETKPLARTNRIFSENPELANIEVGRNLMGNIGATGAVLMNIARQQTNTAKEYQDRLNKFKESFAKRNIDMYSH